MTAPQQYRCCNIVIVFRNCNDNDNKDVNELPKLIDATIICVDSFSILFILGTNDDYFNN